MPALSHDWHCRSLKNFFPYDVRRHTRIFQTASTFSARKRRRCRLQHDPEKWVPVSRLREAPATVRRLACCFGGRRPGGKGSCFTKNIKRREESKRSPPALK